MLKAKSRTWQNSLGFIPLLANSSTNCWISPVLRLRLRPLAVSGFSVIPPRHHKLAAFVQNGIARTFTINRASGAAEHPRTGERLLPGLVFNGEIVLHVYEKDDPKKMVQFVRHGLGIIQEASSLGAGGSRGSGRVSFENVQEETIALDKLTV